MKDGEEALEFLYKIGKYKDAPTPSLMLLDINMPKMNGFEVLEKLKTDVRHKKMPIIMLTTSEREKDIETAYNLGCNSYICKPVNFENFIDAVIKIQQYWLILCKIP